MWKDKFYRVVTSCSHVHFEEKANQLASKGYSLYKFSISDGNYYGVFRLDRGGSLSSTSLEKLSIQQPEVSTNMQGFAD